MCCMARYKAVECVEALNTCSIIRRHKKLLLQQQQLEQNQQQAAATTRVYLYRAMDVPVYTGRAVQLIVQRVYGPPYSK